MAPQRNDAAGRAGDESPFRRLAALISGIEPGASPIDLSIGEPRHAVPDFVAPVLAAGTAAFSRYPPITGSADFRRAVADWLDRRFALNGAVDADRHVLPLAGSREGLFLAAFTARDRRTPRPDKPVLLLPNPFYHAYAAAARAIEVEPVFFDVGPETGFLPDPDRLDPSLLERTLAAYIASPAAPQGTAASKALWRRLIGLARRHDFMLFADECYSEIYRDEAPVGALEAAAETETGFDRLVVFNSLSKRSNLAGLRCGFAAGDAAFLADWARFRNRAAPQVPLPVQSVAAAAYRDEAHVVENRRLYNEKFASAARILDGRFNAYTPDGGFFLWLDMSHVGGGEPAALRLWRDAGVRTIPGGYLSGLLPDGRNPDEDFLRLALVEDLARTEEAMSRIASALC